MRDELVIRSYRRVFRVDRRIYRVDRWALPVPGGVPMRGVLYFAVALGAVLVAGALPLVGDIVGLLSAPLRLVVLPVGVAVLGTQAAPDGRVAHRFAIDWLRLRVRPRRRCAGRPVHLEGERTVWGGVLPTGWDEHAPELHRARVRGPARVTFARPVALAAWRRRLIARAAANGPTDRSVVIGPGQMLEVRR